LSLSDTVLGRHVSLRVWSRTQITLALRDYGLDQRHRRSETSEEVDVRQGQNALGSLSLSTGLTPSHNRAARIIYASRNLFTVRVILRRSCDVAYFSAQ